MQRSVRTGSLQLATVLGVVLLGAMMSGCPARGIGDPCVPEAIPGGGFDQREIYVETSSVQCRTRTCMVFRLSGDPSKVVGEESCPAGTAGCVDRALPVNVSNSAERVFCTCRCSATDGDSNTPLCDCTDGFHCVDVLTAGGAGVRGGYCVPNELCTADEDCASGRCNLEAGGVCAT